MYRLHLIMQGRGSGLRARLTTRAIHSPRATLRLSMFHELAIDRPMKADSTRAIAVAITVRRLPFRSSDRKRPHAIPTDTLSYPNIL